MVDKTMDSKGFYFWIIFGGTQKMEETFRN